MYFNEDNIPVKCILMGVCVMEKVNLVDINFFDNNVNSLEFVDWNWQPYFTLQAFPETRQQQISLLYGTGLYEGDGLEYSFVPTKRMEILENELYKLYTKIRVVDHSVSLCNEVFSTSKIEGANTTLLRTQQIHDGDEIDQSNFFSESMILGGFKATEYLNKQELFLTLDQVITVWNILVENACANGGIRGDRFRIGHVQVGNHVGLNPELLEEAMQCWVNYYNSSVLQDHPFIKAALLHFSFEFIHPFCDGNGRLGRLLMNNFLIKNGLEKVKGISFSHSIEKDLSGYTNSLNQGDNVYTDCTAFIEYMLAVFFDAFNDVMPTK